RRELGLRAGAGPAGRVTGRAETTAHAAKKAFNVIGGAVSVPSRGLKTETVCPLCATAATQPIVDLKRCCLYRCRACTHHFALPVDQTCDAHYESGYSGFRSDPTFRASRHTQP